MPPISGNIHGGAGPDGTSLFVSAPIITPDQIAAAVAADFPASEATLVIVGDGKLFLDALKAGHPSVEVIPADQLDLDSPTPRKGGV